MEYIFQELCVIYLCVGIVWGMFAGKRQMEEYGDKNVGVACLLNAIGWPLAMLLAMVKYIIERHKKHKLMKELFDLVRR